MSLSLVSYATSSDEDSDYEDNEETLSVKQSQSSESISISIEKQNGPTTKSLNLPQPKHVTSKYDEDDKIEKDNFKLNLPVPKKFRTNVEEDDDEFLHKKVQPSLVAKPSKSKPQNIRQPVKITIPSLTEFGDDDLPKQKIATIGPSASKSSGLIGILPPPKFHAAFGNPKEKPDNTSTAAASSIKPTIKNTTSLVPHTVSNKMKQAAAKSKTTAAAVVNKKTNLALNYNNSDDSDNEEDGSGGDFFSLNKEDKLPEVSASEISAMVAKKATQMAEFSKNLNDVEQNICMAAAGNEEYVEKSSTSYVPNHDQINIEALIGARAAKRSRKEDIQFIDISQDQVTSSQDEWRRNQLQNETQYQPTGRLNVGDPGAGTKKKHQITYLAYQAKANEAELQAMWATNRQSRRQTQSKYGF